jgi:hypothetical protein
MKVQILLLLYILTNSFTTNGQHCKFDGSNVFVIKFVNAKGQPKSIVGYTAILKMADDTSKTRCKNYSSKQFDTCKKVLLHTEDKIWNSYAQKYSSLKLFKIKECYAIILSDDELTCLLSNSGTFQIAVQHKSKVSSIAFTPSKKEVYPLCTSYGNWADIKPFVIKLSNTINK